MITTDDTEALVEQIQEADEAFAPLPHLLRVAAERYQKLDGATRQRLFEVYPKLNDDLLCNVADLLEEAGIELVEMLEAETAG